MKELDNCPFCNGKAVLTHWSPMFRTSRFPVVECMDCGAMTWLYYETEQDAVEAWNRRPNNG